MSELTRRFRKAIEEDAMSDVLEALIEEGADPNEPFDDGLLPIAAAVLSEAQGAVFYLSRLTEDIDVYIPLKEGKKLSIVTYSIQKGYLDIAEWLIAVRDNRGLEKDVIDDNGLNLLMISVVGYPESKECMKFLCRDKIGLDYKTEYGLNCCGFAVSLGNSEALDMFLEAGCNVNEDQEGISLLEFCIVEKQIECVKTLLKYNVEIDEMLVFVAEVEEQNDIAELLQSAIDGKHSS